MSLIRKNFIYNNLLGFTNIIVPIIIFPYVSRVFGPTGLGIVSFAISLTATFVIIASLGIPIYGIREIAKVKDNKEQLSKTYSEIIVIQIVWLFISLFIYAGWIYFSNTFNDEPIIRWVSFFHILSMVGLLNWFYQGIENYKFITIVNFIIKILTIGLLFLLVSASEEYWLYYAIIVGATFLGCVLSIFYSLKYISFQFKNLNLKRHLNSIGVLFGTQLAIGIYINLDIVFLNYLASEEQVGYYAPANKLVKVCLLFITSLGTVLLPKLSQHIKSGKIKETKNILSKSIQFVFLVSLPIIVLLWILAPEIIQVFAGSSFKESVPLLRYLVPLIFFIGMSNIFGLQILVPFNKERKLMIAVLIGALISIALNIALIPNLESLGAVYSVLITELIIALLTLLAARKVISFRVNYKSIVIYLLLAMLLIPVCMILNTYFDGKIYLIVTSMMCFIIYVGGLFLSKDAFFKESIWTPILKLKK